MVPARLLACLLVALLVTLLVAGGVEALADEEPVPRGYVRVPDVHRLEPERAARKLADARLNIGRVFEVQVPARWRIGLVIQQSPPPGTVLRVGFPVHVRVSATANGPAAGREAPLDWARAGVPARTALPTPPAPVAPAPRETAPQPAVQPAVPPVDRRAPQPTSPRPARTGPLPAPVIANPGASDVPPAVPVPDDSGNEVPPAVLLGGTPLEGIPLEAGPADQEPAGEASGSPDAPRVAPAADPARVPALLGLPLTDAEQQVRASTMTLYVERVAGHPVGRILEQIPAPGAPRPPAGVIRVVVAAGGDHLADVAPAPLVEVREIAVPDLLDRTGPQAQRILEDLGLRCDAQEAARGPAGRVADQRPAAGTVLPKGSTVIVKVAASTPRRPAASPAPGAPAPSGAQSRPGSPAPLAPAPGTALGGEATMAVGFTWRPVPGAAAYVIEVEERGPTGWVANARQVTRQGAVVLEVVRLSEPPGVLRWRVRAVTKGRHGAPCDWVVLR